MLKSLEEIKSAATSGASPYWFSADTMRFFDTRVGEAVYPTTRGAYFITSEQFDDDAPRLFSVRYCDDDGRVNTVGDFQGYGTANDANDAARHFAEMVTGTDADPLNPPAGH